MAEDAIDGEASAAHGDAGSLDAATRPHVTSLIRYIAIAFIGGCLIAVSKAVPRDGATFDWTNRVGVLLLLALTVSYAIRDVWVTFKDERFTDDQAERWARLAVSLVIPVVLLLKGWDRVLDALWLQ